MQLTGSLRDHVERGAMSGTERVPDQVVARAKAAFGRRAAATARAVLVLDGPADGAMSAPPSRPTEP
jgi:hypothetical protein